MPTKGKNITYMPTHATMPQATANSNSNMRPTKGWQAPKFEQPKPLFNNRGSYT